MFCNRCGKPIEGDGILCDECAAAAANAPEETAAPETPVETPVVPEAPAEAPAPAAVPEEPAFTLGSTEPPKKKKKKTGLVLGIVAVVIAALAAAVALNWDWVTGLFAPKEEPETIVPPEVRLQEVEMSSIENQADKLASIYEKLLATDFQTSVTSQNGSVSVNLKLGDTTLEMLEPYLPEELGDISWLSDVTISIDSVVEEDGMRGVITAGLGKTSILTADVVYDYESSMAYITIPQLSDTPLQVEMDPELMIVYQYALQDSAATQEAAEAILGCLPDKETFRKLVVDYAEVVLAELDKVTESEATLSIGDKSVKATALTAKIGTGDMIDIADAVLTKAKDDPVILQFVNDLAETLGELYPDEDFSDMAPQFVTTMNDALESLEYARENADTSTTLRLTTYLDENDKIVGRKLAVAADGNSIEVLRYTVIENAKDDYTFELAVNVGPFVYNSEEYMPIRLTGNSVTKDGKQNASYSVIWEDATYVTLELKDYTENGGTIRIIPGKALLDLLNDEMDLGLPTSVLDQNMALELSFKAAKDTADLGIKIIFADEALIDLSFAISLNDLTVTVPESAVDVTDEEALLGWLEKIDIEAYVELLEDAGVPSELLEQLVESLSSAVEHEEPSVESDLVVEPEAA